MNLSGEVWGGPGLSRAPMLRSGPPPRPLDRCGGTIPRFHHRPPHVIQGRARWYILVRETALLAPTEAAADRRPIVPSVPSRTFLCWPSNRLGRQTLPLAHMRQGDRYRGDAQIIPLIPRSTLQLLTGQFEAAARHGGPVAGLVGIEGGVVSGVINLESPSV
jgi:hypothetical protein